MNYSFVSLVLFTVGLALPFSIAGSNMAGALLALALLLRARTDGAKMAAAWRREPALAALALYAAAGLIAAALSAAPSESLRDAVKDLHRLVTLGLLVAALALEPKTKLRSALGISFSAMALYGLWQSAHSGPSFGAFRARAFVHPVVFGEQMALAVLGGVCILIRPTPSAGRRAAAIFTCLVFAALVMSQTRMALIAAAVGFALVTLLEPRARRWSAPALCLVAGVAAAWELLLNNGRTLSSVFRPFDPHNSQQARFILWDVAWRMFKDHPLTGAGPGGYGRLYASYHTGIVESQDVWSNAHNLYLQQLAERGLLGGIALLILCGTLLARAVRAARLEADTRALWAAGSVAAFLAMSMTETAFQSEQFASLLLLIWAWGTTSLRRPGENL
ncbi:MAG: O-antigen ligase family protein [Elusimicrobiota bacterium]